MMMPTTFIFVITPVPNLDVQALQDLEFHIRRTMLLDDFQRRLFEALPNVRGISPNWFTGKDEDGKPLIFWILELVLVEDATLPDPRPLNALAKKFEEEELVNHATISAAFVPSTSPSAQG